MSRCFNGFHFIRRIRMREGFKFAHSSSGIINMVLQVDMVEVSIYTVLFINQMDNS